MRRNFDPMSIVFIGLMLLMMVRSRLSGYASITDWILDELYLLPGIIIGLTFHEFGHAWVAQKLGDDTARLQGRVSLNPAAHIDIVGFFALLLVGFGWGKPVPVNSYNFKHPRRDDLLVSIAGVTMNLLISVVFIVILKILYMTLGPATSEGSLIYVVERLVLEVIFINFVLMIFNLMPIPPLDGFNLITEIFNLKKYSWWGQLYEKGFLLLLIFILFDFSGRVLSPILGVLMKMVYAIL